jgi:hypothetical protein
VNANGLRKLLLGAVAFNAARGKGTEKPAKAARARTRKPAAAKAKPVRAQGKTPKGARIAPTIKRAAI